METNMRKAMLLKEASPMFSNGFRATLQNERWEIFAIGKSAPWVFIGSTCTNVTLLRLPSVAKLMLIHVSDPATLDDLAFKRK